VKPDAKPHKRRKGRRSAIKGGKANIQMKQDKIENGVNSNSPVVNTREPAQTKNPMVSLPSSNILSLNSQPTKPSCKLHLIIYILHCI
jgi:hypothetical protein